MLPQERLEQEFNLLSASEGSSPFDLFLRLFILSLGAIVVAIVIGQPGFLLWPPVYVALGVGNFVLIRGTAQPVSPARFWLMTAIGLVAMIWLGSFAICLSYLDGGAYMFMGYSMCIGMAIYVLTSHTAFGVVAWRDLIAVTYTSLGLAASAFLNSATLYVGLAALLGGLLVLTYFFFGFRQSIHERIALREREEARNHDQKLKSLGQLTSGVAHDFNNLLTVMGGNIELAMLEASSAEQNARLKDAREAVDRGAVLVSQLLAYSRKSPLNQKEISSAVVLARVEDITSRVVPSGIETYVDVSGDEAVLMVDAALLETALLNLIINARDAMVGGHGKIRVSTYLIPENKQLAIAVEDSGPGMDAVTLERATEPFFTTKGVGEGTGLGLSMVKGFAEQSGGGLVLSHRAGGGLVATILLPAKDPASLTQQA